MATIKNVKIQKNKILTYAVNKSGFKTVYGSVLVNQNQTININMKNLDDVSEPFELGDRLFGISSFVDYFTPSGTYDVDSLKYLKISQTTGTSLTNLAVVKSTWLSQVETTLGIETPKGTSNDFVFTYDGSKWDLTGATTQNNVDLEDYGISFDGTPAENDVITVTETQYNKFAFFVLDANYRTIYMWRSSGSGTDMPIQYNANPQNANESATYFNQYAFNNFNLTNFPIFNASKNLGIFILSNGIKINALVPTAYELNIIYTNKVALDSFDYTKNDTNNLTNWRFNNNNTCWSCLEQSNINSWYIFSNGTPVANGKNISGFCPIFEVPVM